MVTAASPLHRAVDALRAALGTADEPARVADCIRAFEEADAASWLDDELVIWDPRPVSVGVLLLSGHHARYADLYLRMQRRDRPPHGPLEGVPPAEWAGTEGARMGWIRILRGEWRPLETRRVPGRDIENLFVRPALEAAARGDASAVLRLATAEASRWGDAPPSILVAGVRRLLEQRPLPSPSAPERPADPARFDAADAPAGILARAPLREVLARGAGPRVDEVVERLGCGHRRGERAGAWAPARRRRCLLCVPVAARAR